jgi:hypothetical protein
MIVYVIIEENEYGAICAGVYSNYAKAELAKFAFIREQYSIPLDEVADADLEDEVYDMGNVTYRICEEYVIE